MRIIDITLRQFLLDKPKYVVLFSNKREKRLQSCHHCLLWSTERGPSSETDCQQLAWRCRNWDMTPIHTVPSADGALDTCAVTCSPLWPLVTTKLLSQNRPM